MHICLSPSTCRLNVFFPLSCQHLLRISYLAGKFNQKRDAFKPCRKPKYRAKFSDTSHKINPPQPKGFLLATLSFLIFRKIWIFLLLSFSIFCHSILHIFLSFGNGWYCWFNLRRLSILVNYYAFFYHRYI